MLWVFQSCSSYWDTWYWCFVFERKVFLSIIFLIIKVHSRNETNMATIITFIPFVIGHYNHVHLIGIKDIDAFNLQEKLFFPPSFLSLMFTREMRQTWILVIISILFVMGTVIIFSSLGYTILMFSISRKSFSFHHFSYNLCSSVKWGKLDYS